MITFTVDLEDPTSRYEPDGRYVVMTRKILKLCETYHRHATFFIIGRVADSAPRLIREIAADGHEVAYHSHNHVSLTEEDPKRFKRETTEDKDKFEQITGKAVAGFRAPRFSLTPKSIWAIDILGELGFKYSSSIMPTHMSRFGFPGASPFPSQWPNGMVELPLPIAELGPLHLPYLGGIYLYALPSALTQYWIKCADEREMLWTYTHPYDFDREEKFSQMPGEPLWVSVVLYLARKVAARKIRQLFEIDLHGARPLGDRVRELLANPPPPQ